jgi:hypothetical protein
MENVTTEKVEWIWTNKIARGKLTLFEGDPGVGKSFTTLAIAAALSRGKALPGDITPEMPPLRSLVISAEDSPSDTIKPRLADLGADMNQIAIPHREAVVSLQVSFLDKILDQWPAAFCVVDPVIAFSNGKDNNKASDVRQLMGPLVDLADRRRCAIVLLRHLNKNVHASAIHRGQGSVDYATRAREGGCCETFTNRSCRRSPRRLAPDRFPDDHRRCLASRLSAVWPAKENLACARGTTRSLGYAKRAGDRAKRESLSDRR